MTHRPNPAERGLKPRPADTVTLSDLIESRALEATTPAPVTTQAQGVVHEIGGRKDGTDPTRYGDWEFRGRCIDF